MLKSEFRYKKMIFLQRKEYVFFIVFQEASPIYTHTWRMETSREDEREDQRAEEGACEV